MSLDEIEKKTTIYFPRPIGRKDAKDMLCYLSSNLPGNVSGRVEYFINYIYNSKAKASFEDKGTLKLTSTIKSLRKTMAFDTFVSEPYGIDTSFISQVSFQRVPDWELSDYRPEVIELWDDVRECIGKYFEEVLKVQDSKKE